MASIVAIDARLVGKDHTGDSTYWTSLVAALASLQPDLQVLLLSNAPPPPGIPHFPGFRWITIPNRSSRWWSMVSFPMTARKLGAGAMHTQYSMSPLVGNRGVVTVHDVSFFIGPQWFRPRDRRILQWSVPRSIRRARAVIAVSETDRREILNVCPEAEAKTQVIANACPDWIRRIPRDLARETVRKETGLEGDYLLTVGTRWPRKNMNLALEAVNGLPGELPYRLAITGKAGWGSQELGGRGFATGYVTNEVLSALYSAAQMYLAPSLHEGFGIPLLEAFRCGCPVMCSSGGALPEVAADAAIVMPSWEPAAWTRELVRVLPDSGILSDLRERGFRRESHYRWADSARLTLDVYRRIVP